jgi:hypothetical protein
VPALIHALVACGWFGIQTLFDGIAVHLMLAALFDSWAQLGGVGEVLALELGLQEHVARGLHEPGRQQRRRPEGLLRQPARGRTSRGRTRPR